MFLQVTVNFTLVGRLVNFISPFYKWVDRGEIFKFSKIKNQMLPLKPLYNRLHFIMRRQLCENPNCIAATFAFEGFANKSSPQCWVHSSWVLLLISMPVSRMWDHYLSLWFQDNSQTLGCLVRYNWPSLWLHSITHALAFGHFQWGWAGGKTRVLSQCDFTRAPTVDISPSCATPRLRNGSKREAVLKATAVRSPLYRTTAWMHCLI